MVDAHPKDFRQQQQNNQLEEHQANHQRGDLARVASYQSEVDRSTDGDEEQPQEQSLERLEIALKLVPIFAVGQHYPGQESAKCRRQAHLGHQQGDTDNQQQRRGGEQLAKTGTSDSSEQRSGQEPSDHHQTDDRHQHCQSLPPGGQTRNPIGSVLRGTGVHRLAMARTAVTSTVGARQEWHQCQHGNHRDVLEQQHGKGVLARIGLHQPLLGQSLQHHGSRGQGEDHAHRQADAPGLPKSHRQRSYRQRGNGDLGAAKAEDRPAHPPQSSRLQLQADQEQHHHHAELGKVHDVLPFVTDQPPAERTDDRPGDQVTEHRAQAEPLGQRHRHHRRRQVDECLEEQPFTVHGGFPGLAKRRQGRY